MAGIGFAFEVDRGNFSAVFDTLIEQDVQLQIRPELYPNQCQA